MIRKLWTDEKPTTSGYYWFKSADGTWIDVVRIHRGTVYFPPRNGSGIGGAVKLKMFVEGKWHGPIPAPSLYRANKHDSALKELTLAVADCLTRLDATMNQPESGARGKKIAAIANTLQYANDIAMHIGLNMEFDAMHALKQKRARLMRKE